MVRVRLIDGREFTSPDPALYNIAMQALRDRALLELEDPAQPGKRVAINWRAIAFVEDDPRG